MAPPRLIAAFLALALFALLAPIAGAQAPTEVPDRVEAEASQRLAVEFARVALTLVGDSKAYSDELKGANRLMREAVALDPESVELRRRALDMAMWVDDRESVAEDIKAIARLDPDDDNIRLRRIGLAIDERYQVVEERVSAYEFFLKPDAGLGDAVRSRLALDLALLHRQQGNIEAFAEALSEAMAIDPSNRNAAAIGAGFFRTWVDDPAGEAELLISLMLSDPTDATSLAMIASLLLEHGAFAGATRMYDLLITIVESRGELPDDKLVADQLLAHLGLADFEGAAAILDRRRMIADRIELVLQMRERGKDRMTSEERNAVKGEMHPMLLLLETAALALAEDDTAAAAAAATIETYDRVLGGSSRMAMDNPAGRARIGIEQALLIVMMGTDEDLARVPEILATANAALGLSDDAKARFDGWIALREKRPDDAIETLLDVAHRDGPASLGLARALWDVGRTDEAKAQLRDLWLRQPGTVVGLLARRDYEKATGESAPDVPASRELERLLSEVPTTIDRYVESPSLALDIKLIAPIARLDAYDPIKLELEIANNSPFPLAIDPDGPIRPTVVLLVKSNLRRGPNEYVMGVEMNPVVVRIDRRLRLEPRSRLTIPLDLRFTDLGRLLDNRAIGGGNFFIKAVLNPVAVQESRVKPGPFGAESTSRSVRVDGVEITDPVLRDLLQSATHPENDQYLRSLATLAQIAVQPTEGLTDTQRRLLQEIQTSLRDEFYRLGPVAQAWLVAMMPRNRMLPEILATVRTAEHTLLTVSYLSGAVSLTDPLLQKVQPMAADSFEMQFVRAIAVRMAREVEAP